MKSPSAEYKKRTHDDRLRHNQLLKRLDPHIQDLEKQMRQWAGEHEDPITLLVLPESVEEEFTEFVKIKQRFLYGEAPQKEETTKEKVTLLFYKGIQIHFERNEQP